MTVDRPLGPASSDESSRSSGRRSRDRRRVPGRPHPVPPSRRIAPSRTRSGSGPASATRRTRIPSSRGSSRGRMRRSARKGIPRSSATAAAGRSSRFVRARIARVAASPSVSEDVRPGRQHVPDPVVVVGCVGREDSRPDGARPSEDPLGEPLLVPLDHPDGSLDDRRRAAEVRDQVVPSKTRQPFGDRKDAPDIGQPPAVDRLVVVADQEDPVLGGGQQAGRARAGTGRRPGPRRPAAHGTSERHAPEMVRLGLEDGQRAGHEVVEVEPAALRQRPARRRRRSRARGPASGSASTSAAVTRCSSLRVENSVSRRRRSAGSAPGTIRRSSASRSRSGSTEPTRRAAGSPDRRHGRSGSEPSPGPRPAGPAQRRHARRARRRPAC